MNSQTNNSARRAVATLVVVLAAGMPVSATAQTAGESEQLPLPAEAEPSHSVPYREHRVGGRLERVTVERENGLDETYRNKREDTIWSAEENELGEVPNTRRWILRTW